MLMKSKGWRIERRKYTPRPSRWYESIASRINNRKCGYGLWMEEDPIQDDDDDDNDSFSDDSDNDDSIIFSPVLYGRQSEPQSIPGESRNTHAPILVCDKTTSPHGAENMDLPFPFTPSWYSTISAQQKKLTPQIDNNNSTNVNDTKTEVTIGCSDIFEHLPGVYRVLPETPPSEYSYKLHENEEDEDNLCAIVPSATRVNSQLPTTFAPPPQLDTNTQDLMWTSSSFPQTIHEWDAPLMHNTQCHVTAYTPQTSAANGFMMMAVPHSPLRGVEEQDEDDDHGERSMLPSSSLSNVVTASDTCVNFDDDATTSFHMSSSAPSLCQQPPASLKLRYICDVEDGEIVWKRSRSLCVVPRVTT